MYDTLPSAGAGNRAFENDAEVISRSRISAITERLKNCAGIASNANGNMAVELDRILGAVPESASAKVSGDPRANDGALGELDNLVSYLTEALERTNGLSLRLSQV